MKAKFKVAINSHIINKVTPGDKATFAILTRKFETAECTALELAEAVNQGHPFCAQHQGSRKDENFICSDVLAVDIDSGMTVPEALANPFVKSNASFIYPTPSHTDVAPRLRIVFMTERTIADPIEMKAAFTGLIRKFGGDASCKDPCRLFYGSQGSQPIMFNNVLSNDQLALLIELGNDAPSVSDKKTKSGKQYPIAVRRSGVRVSPDHPVTTAAGMTMPFADVPFGVEVHCPVHDDRNPSAFIVKSDSGGKGAYCHSCAATFWMKSPFDWRYAAPYDFYRTDEIIIQKEFEEDPGTYYDEDDAPAGLIELAGSQRRNHTMSERFLTNISDHDGVTIIKSQKDTGKTHVLANLVAKHKAEGKSIALFGHRQMLLLTSSARLGLDCYIRVEDGKIKRNSPTRHFAICIDSLTQLNPKYQKFDVVILDEAEQLMAHLTGSTLDTKRRACYQYLFHYLKVAKSVIVADADIGPITIEGLYQAIGPNAGYHFYLNTFKERGRDFHHYASETHLMQDMIASVRAGGRHYVATNSRTKASELKEAIRKEAGDHVKILLVTAKTNREADVQQLFTNIKTEILAYDVVIATPTIGTGIDITFDGNAQLVDTVFGFFVGRTTTHFDIDQQLARVRRPKAIKVWVTPEVHFFETEPEVILREARQSGALNDSIVGIDADGSPLLDETYLNVYAHVTAVSRASKNSLRKNLLDLRKRNGWNVIEVTKDDDQANIGKEVQREAKASVEAARVADINAAAKLSSDEYGLLKESSVPLNKAEDDAMRRFEMEKFYREDISPYLADLDNQGRYRKKILLLEIYLSPTADLVEKDMQDSKLTTILTDTKKRTLKQHVLQKLLTAAGLADDKEPIKLDTIITAADLKQFVQVCAEVSPRLQDMFGIALQGNFDKKPMEQLGKFLRLMGLSLERLPAKKIKKDKIYPYRVNKYDWDTAYRYVSQRKSRDSDEIVFVRRKADASTSLTA